MTLKTSNTSHISKLPHHKLICIGNYQSRDCYGFTILYCCGKCTAVKNCTEDVAATLLLTLCYRITDVLPCVYQCFSEKYFTCLYSKATVIGLQIRKRHKRAGKLIISHSFSLQPCYLSMSASCPNGCQFLPPFPHLHSIISK